MLDVKLSVIGNDRETIDGVQEYLLRAGAGVRTTAFLEEAQFCAVGADAVILFADHYPLELALRTVVELSVGLIVIVTAEVGYFSDSRTAESLAPRVVVLRRPVWGWMLLDAVRLGTGRGAGEG